MSATERANCVLPNGLHIIRCDPDNDHEYLADIVKIGHYGEDCEGKESASLMQGVVSAGVKF